MKILVVEDDQHLAESLSHILKEQQYIVDTVYNGLDGLYYASNSEYDVIVLDVMLPKMNGYEVIKALRKLKISTPTIMLTAKSDITDKITGLDAGADDYMIKPFSPPELLARIRALSRRTGEVVVDELAVEDLILNVNTHTLSSHERTVSLSNKEFQILSVLMRNANNIFSKETLINKVWGAETDINDNNVEAYISFLRKKLFYVNSKMTITSVRMVGYRLEEIQND